MVRSEGSDSADRVRADPDVTPADGDAPSDAVRVARLAGTKARVARLRDRAGATTAGEVQRRINELEVTNQAAILAALAMVLVVPALVTVAAVLPVGSSHGLAASWGRHLGLDAQAAANVRKLFITDRTVHTSTTAFSAVFTIVSAYAWPAQLQRTYNTIWGLPRRGMRDLWRPVLWVPSLFVLSASVAASGSIAPGPIGALLTGLVGFPVLLAWIWWTQHFLLAGRICWRALLPGALATTIALVASSVLTSLLLSRAVTTNYDRYGPIGVVFTLMSWLTIFSVVMVAGVLVGHTIWSRHGGADRPGAQHPPSEEPT